MSSFIIDTTCPLLVSAASAAAAAAAAAAADQLLACLLVLHLKFYYVHTIMQRKLTYLNDANNMISKAI